MRHTDFEKSFRLHSFIIKAIMALTFIMVIGTFVFQGYILVTGGSYDKGVKASEDTVNLQQQQQSQDTAHSISGQ